MQDEKELFTLRFNRMNSVRVEYAPWSIEGPVPLELQSDPPAHNKMLEQAEKRERQI